MEARTEIRQEQMRTENTTGLKKMKAMVSKVGATFEMIRATEDRFFGKSKRQELHLGSRKTFYEAFRQTLELEVVKLTARSSQVKEETTSSLRARDARALTTLRNFAQTDWLKRKWWDA
jgi:hypothetical protein